MKPIDIFSKRLDEIFEMGGPTKALIYDAFHKATEPPQVTDICGRKRILSEVRKDQDIARLAPPESYKDGYLKALTNVVAIINYDIERHPEPKQVTDEEIMRLAKINAIINYDSEELPISNAEENWADGAKTVRDLLTKTDK